MRTGDSMASSCFTAVTTHTMTGCVRLATYHRNGHDGEHVTLWKRVNAHAPGSSENRAISCHSCDTVKDPHWAESPWG